MPPTATDEQVCGRAENDTEDAIKPALESDRRKVDSDQV